MTEKSHADFRSTCGGVARRPSRHIEMDFGSDWHLSCIPLASHWRATPPHPLVLLARRSPPAVRSGHHPRRAPGRPSLCVDDPPAGRAPGALIPSGPPRPRTRPPAAPQPMASNWPGQCPQSVQSLVILCTVSVNSADALDVSPCPARRGPIDRLWHRACSSKRDRNHDP